MKDLIVKNVDMFGDTIMAAQDENGNIWAGVSYFCRALGMNKGQKDRQVTNIGKDKTLSKGCCKFAAGIFDSGSETLALRFDFIPLWLAKISITDTMQKDHPDLADKLLQYQLKAKDILADAFMPKARVPQTIPEQIQLIAQGYGELNEEVQTIKKDLEDFKNDMPILGIEESKITNAVKKKGVECLGGKESNAYNDRSVRGQLYSDLHNQLRREFGVSTYKAIKRNQTDIAIKIIQSYTPSFVLTETIKTANAQLSLKNTKKEA